MARLSHELRTPLTAILGYTEILIAKQTNREEKTQLETVRRNGRHLLNLLNDILDLSKIEAGKLDLDISRIAIAPFLADFHSVASGGRQRARFGIHH